MKLVNYRSYNTWEPKRNLNCTELINEFEKKLKEGNKKSGGRGRGRPKTGARGTKRSGESSNKTGTKKAKLDDVRSLMSIS